MATTYNENNILASTPNTSSLRDYQIFEASYYSGDDVSIYFGDIWVDEINNITFNMNEQVQPIYGYADYIYSKLATGTRIVQGAFTINFTEAGYLYAIVDKIAASKGLNAIPDAASRNSHLITNSQFTMDGMTFDDFATSYENKIWGSVKVDKQTQNKPSLARSSFDIVISYGFADSSTLKAPTGLNSSANTVKTIREVTLTGVTQIIDTSDNPIGEQYTFIARDIEFV